MKNCLKTEAWVFPGQGLHDIKNLRDLLSQKQLSEDLDIISELVKTSIKKLSTELDSETLLRNDINSLIISVLNTHFIKKFKSKGFVPHFVGGYSLGMYSALAVAEVISLEKIYEIIFKRAQIMTEANHNKPGIMFSIIGVDDKILDNILVNFRANAHRAWISNYNAPNHLSISCHSSDEKELEILLKSLKPKKFIKIQSAGGWHSPLLEDATNPFELFLDKLKLQRPLIPIVDNVSGQWLDSDPEKIKTTLVKHLTHPVKWSDNINCLISGGTNCIIEVGCGDLLTKFGFFIDRSVQHLTAAKYLSFN